MIRLHSHTSPELRALHSLARAMGVLTRFRDGLGRRVTVGAETLARVCAALGAPLSGPADAPEAWRAHRAAHAKQVFPTALVAWDGAFPPQPLPDASATAELRLEDGTTAPLLLQEGTLSCAEQLPLGYHRLTVELRGAALNAAVIAAPTRTFRHEGEGTARGWGVGTHLAALRARRSRSLGDLRDLESVCRWVGSHGGDLVTVLPLYPTFNSEPPEPSPYSGVSRLFWSELILDLEDAHRPAPAPAPASLDVRRAHEEVWTALAGRAVPEAALLDGELVRYAQFRGAQARLGRNWRAWPSLARTGTLAPADIDGDVERFHLVAQSLVRGQLHDLRQRLDGQGIRLGLDLAVGVHPDAYDPWSRQALFCEGISVGAPPDAGFPSGQDWGFAPVIPEQSRREGHRYLAASIGHQAELAGVLRVDHIMAWSRLYWIPHGHGLHEGTYVGYPADELFAILTLESNRHRCEVVGENLGTVPKAIDQALPRHGIRGMYLAQFEAPRLARIAPPRAADVALVGTHDTPTFAGWIKGIDIAERVQYRLLAEDAAPHEREHRHKAVHALAHKVGASEQDPRGFLAALLDWLGRSDSPLVVPWLEDLWLEEIAVNLPGTPSFQRPNWQHPMGRLLDDVFADPDVAALLQRLAAARRAAPPTT